MYRSAIGLTTMMHTTMTPRTSVDLHYTII